MGQQEQPWYKCVQWGRVAALGIPVWATAIGFVAWHKLHQSAESVAIVAMVPPQANVPELGIDAPAVHLGKYEPELPLTFVPTNVAYKQVAGALKPEPMREALDPGIAEAMADGFKQLFTIVLSNRGGDNPQRREGEKPQAAPIERVLPTGFKSHGTQIGFARSYDLAAATASKQKKLIFMLHLSGNIESDGFT